MKLGRLANSVIAIAAVTLLVGGVAGLIAIAFLTSEPEGEYTPAAEHQQVPIPTLLVERIPTPTAAPTLAVVPNPTPATTPTAQVESRSAPTAVPAVTVAPTQSPTVVPTVTVGATPKPTTSPTVRLESTPKPVATPTVSVESASVPTAVPTGTAEPTPTVAIAPTLSVNPTTTPMPETSKISELPEKSRRLALPSDPSAKGTESTGKGSGQGTVYTWEDSGRTLRVVLQDDLVVQETAANTPDDVVVARRVGDSIVQRQLKHDQDARPVFRSESGGGLMTLPGGVLLALDSEWDRARVDSFFFENDISKDRTSELSFIENGFLLETEPGFPSLNLANELASKDGVIISSPNWWRQVETK